MRTLGWLDTNIGQYRIVNIRAQPSREDPNLQGYETLVKDSFHLRLIR